MNSFYILEINLLSVASFVIISPILKTVSCAEAFNFNYVPFVYFCFYFHYSGMWVIEDPAVMYVRECFVYVFL